MSDHEDRAHLQELLQTNRRTLRILLHQLASHGGSAYAPPSVVHGIEEARASIRVYKAHLRQLGEAVADDVDDEPLLAQAMGGSGHGPCAAADTRPGAGAFLNGADGGMSALRKLVAQVPQIHDAAVAFRTLFEAACEQVHVLRTYKDVHDLLHDLQLRCYENLIQEVRRFPEDPFAADNLGRYADNLEYIVAALQDIADRSPFIAPPPFWIKTLAQAHADICTALLTTDAALLRRAAAQIKRVLQQHPAQINSQLNSAVRSMRLATLLKAMASIRDVCSSFDVDPHDIDRLDASLAALDGLNQHLTQLVADHDQWQVVDMLLWMIDDLAANAEDMELHWASLKEQTANLYAASVEPWARDLQAQEAQLEHAVAAHDGGNLARCFDSYRRRAILRFYRVDKNLKELCDKLDRIDGPLAFVRGVLE